jgi:phage gp36-like protein
MAIMDDLKKKTGEGLKTLKETAQDIAFNVEKQAKISKRKYVDITKLRRDIQKLYAEIGEYVFDQFSSGKPVDKEDPILKDRISSISRFFLHIRDIEEEIAEIEQTQPPKHNQL